MAWSGPPFQTVPTRNRTRRRGVCGSSDGPPSSVAPCTLTTSPMKTEVAAPNSSPGDPGGPHLQAWACPGTRKNPSARSAGMMASMAALCACFKIGLPGLPAGASGSSDARGQERRRDGAPPPEVGQPGVLGVVHEFLGPLHVFELYDHHPVGRPAALHQPGGPAPNCAACGAVWDAPPHPGSPASRSKATASGQILRKILD